MAISVTPIPASARDFAVPAVVLGTAAVEGTAQTLIRTDATIVAFDATVPTTQAFGDVAATGTEAVGPRRDHLHGMPATPTPNIALTSVNYARIRLLGH